MRERLGIKHIMEVPEGISPYELMSHENTWGDHVVYLRDCTGKTYFVDIENKQLVRAIAPVGLFP